MADILLKDDHDLIHKAVGWALREVGKMDGPLLRNYLKENVSEMPRTMLRYSIEKFSPTERKRWLSA
jgi:3-methyladenine DNA glycosylase AlkD